MSRREDEGRVERTVQEEKDEVEGHGHWTKTDEPKTDDDSSDDFEAHIRKS